MIAMSTTTTATWMATAYPAAFSPAGRRRPAPVALLRSGPVGLSALTYRPASDDTGGGFRATGLSTGQAYVQAAAAAAGADQLPATGDQQSARHTHVTVTTTATITVPTTTVRNEKHDPGPPVLSPPV